MSAEEDDLMAVEDDLTSAVEEDVESIAPGFSSIWIILTPHASPWASLPPSARPPISRLPSASTLHRPLVAVSRIILRFASPSIRLASAILSASNAHPNFSSRLRLFSSSKICTNDALSSDVKLRWNASSDRSSRTGGSRRCRLRAAWTGGWVSSSISTSWCGRGVLPGVSHPLAPTGVLSGRAGMAIYGVRAILYSALRSLSPSASSILAAWGWWSAASVRMAEERRWGSLAWRAAR